MVVYFFGRTVLTTLPPGSEGGFIPQLMLARLEPSVPEQPFPGACSSCLCPCQSASYSSSERLCPLDKRQQSGEGFLSVPEEGLFFLRVGVCSQLWGGVAAKVYVMWHPGMSRWCLTSCSFIPALTWPETALESEGSVNNWASLSQILRM